MRQLHTQVCIAGGGIAGISAALSAARAGAKVLLLEREYLLGGLATLGLIAHYLPLCDGNGHQVSYGIAEELLLLSACLDEQHDIRSIWKKNLSAHPTPRYRYTFQPNLFALLLEKTLLEAGVCIRYGSQVCDAACNSSRILCLQVQEKDERVEVFADAFVDATGDAIVCKAAGAPTALYAEGNIPASWYYDTSSLPLTLCPLGAFDDPDSAEEAAKTSGTTCTGLEGGEITDFCIHAHHAILQTFITKKKEDPSLSLSTIPTIPQLRMVRRICGKTVLKEPDPMAEYDDSIGLIGDWRKRGPSYEIPFSSLYCDAVTNLYTAGRCISADGRMWDQTRVIPACAVSGEAAGLAAALTTDSRCDIQALQAALSVRRIPLHRQELPDFQ